MKKRKINRSLLFLILMGVIVTIVAMSVVYAALSTKLLIDGSVEVQASSFELSVDKADLSEYMDGVFLTKCDENIAVCKDNYVMIGNGKVINEPVISGTSINNLKVSLELPGDQVGFFYKVTNTGSIPVKLIDIVDRDYQISSLNNIESDINLLNSHFAVGHFISDYDGGEININDILCAGESVFIMFHILFDSSAVALPSESLEISNIGVSYEFVQTDQYLCES